MVRSQGMGVRQPHGPVQAVLDFRGLSHLICKMGSTHFPGVSRGGACVKYLSGGRASCRPSSLSSASRFGLRPAGMKERLGRLPHTCVLGNSWPRRCAQHDCRLSGFAKPHAVSLFMRPHPRVLMPKSVTEAPRNPQLGTNCSFYVRVPSLSEREKCSPARYDMAPSEAFLGPACPGKRGPWKQFSEHPLGQGPFVQTEVSRKAGRCVQRLEPGLRCQHGPCGHQPRRLSALHVGSWDFRGSSTFRM